MARVDMVNGPHPWVRVGVPGPICDCPDTARGEAACYALVQVLMASAWGLVIMRNKLLPALIGAILAPLLVLPAMAHHTFVVKYDGSKTVRVSGVITSMSYGNPHITFTVGGWTVETESPAALSAKGLTKNVLIEGAKVTVSGWPARDGSSKLGASSISISGGPSATTRGTAR